MNYALILFSTGLVENIEVWDGRPTFDPPEGTFRVASEEARVSDFYADGEFTQPVVEYPAPPPPTSVSDRQFFQALAMRGVITEDEALAAAGPGTIPAAMLALIDQLPAGERFSAKMLITGATVYERANPLASLIGSLFGWDADALDELWAFAASL